MEFILKRVATHDAPRMLILCALAVAVFAPLCTGLHHDIHVEDYESCNFPIHSFVHLDNGLAGFFILSLLGLFQLLTTLQIFGGHQKPPYRPPRPAFVAL